MLRDSERALCTVTCASCAETTVGHESFPCAKREGHLHSPWDVVPFLQCQFVTMWHTDPARHASRPRHNGIYVVWPQVIMLSFILQHDVLFEGSTPCFLTCSFLDAPGQGAVLGTLAMAKVVTMWYGVIVMPVSGTC